MDDDRYFKAAFAIVLGEMFTDKAAQSEVQSLVVFVNAAARIAIAVIGAHLGYEVWKEKRG